MWENRKKLAKTGLFYYSLVIMNEIYLAKNHLMIKTEYKDPEVHRHSAAHILISLEGPVRFQVDGQEMTGFGAVIPSGLPTVCRRQAMSASDRRMFTLTSTSAVT